MRLRLAVCAALAALAAFAPAAHAKGVVVLQACGPDGCTAVDEAALRTPGVLEGAPVTAPVRAAPFVRLRAAAMDRRRVLERFTLVFVPRTGLLRAEDGTWLEPDAAAVAPLRRLAAGMRLFPAAGLGLPAPASAPSAPPADDGLPAWLLVLGAALLAAAAAAAVPVLHGRRSPAG